MQLLGGSALVAMALTSPSGPAHAQCVPAAGAGVDVVCSGNVDTGFAFAGPGNLGSFRVEEGATVENDPAGSSDAAVDIRDPLRTNFPGVSGDVTNEGTIRDQTNFGDGILVDGSIGGSFLNAETGRITGGNTGIFVGGDVAGAFTNDGTIEGNLGDGVAVSGSIDNAFTNNGAIEGDVDGVFVSGDIAGAFTNHGTIKGDRDGVDVASIAGSFFNSGMIMGKQRGVFVQMGTVAGGFTNNGMIDGDIAGVEIVSAGGQNAAFMNMADAMISGDRGFVSGAGNEALTNAGTITGTGGTAINLGTGTDSLTLLPGSTITGNVLAGDGTDTLRFGGNDTEGSFNLDDIDTGGNTEQYRDFEAFEVTGGTWSFSGETPETFAVTGGTVKGTGIFGGLNLTSGIFAPGDSIGTTTVGNLTLGAASTLQIEVDDAGQSDLVIVTGGVTINGATLQVVELPGSYAGIPLTYTIIRNDGAAAVQGTGFGAITSGLAFLVPTVDLTGGDGNDVVLTLSRNTVTFPDVASTPNQIATFTALQGPFSANATPGSDNETVINAILGLSAEAARAAFDSVSGEIHASVANVLLSQGGLIAGTVGNRLAGLRAGEGPIRPVESPLALATLSFDPKEASSAMLLGMAHDNGSLKDEGSKGFVPDDLRYEAWGRAWGRTGTFDDDGNAAETDGAGAGLMAGGDVALWQGARFGLAAGYSSTRTEADARGSELDADSATILAYLNHVSGAWHAHLIGGYTHHDFDGRRNIIVGVLNRTASSDYDGHQVTVTGEIGYTHEVRGIAVQPIAAVRYGSLTTDSFTETGAGSLNLTSAGDTNQATDTILGARVSTVWRTGDAIIVPQARIAWTHTFGEVTPDLAMAFAGGGDFTVIGVTRDRDALALGVGLNAVVGEDTTAYIDYAATLSSDQDAHALSGGVRVRF